MKRGFLLLTMLFNFARLMPFFNQGEGGAGGSGEGGQGGAGEGGQGGAGEGGQGGQGGQGGGAQPFATFPDEKSFMARVAKEGKKFVGDFLKGLGFEKEDDLKAIISAHKDNEEKNKTEAQRAQEALDAAKKAADDATAAKTAAEERANGIARTAEAKVQALAAGVKPERLDYLLKLADLTAVEVTDGVADTAAVKAAIDKVLADMPELKAQQGAARGGGDHGGQGQGGGNAPLSWDLIKGMDKKEAEKRLPEIMEFMAKNPQK